jgi:hypothetical protein
MTTTISTVPEATAEHQSPGPEGYPVHPLARAFPPLSGNEFSELVEDIRAHGQREPITLYEGQILDGVHRARACHVLGIKPRCRSWDKGAAEGTQGLVDYVVSLNLRRRHLEPGQRAMIATELLPALEAEAKQRQAASRAQPGEKVGAKVVARVPPRSAGKASEHAAKALGVSPRMVRDAKAIKQHAPALAAEVKAGRQTIPQAKRQLRRTRAPDIIGAAVDKMIKRAAPPKKGGKPATLREAIEQLVGAAHNLVMHVKDPKRRPAHRCCWRRADELLKQIKRVTAAVSVKRESAS